MARRLRGRKQERWSFSAYAPIRVNIRNYSQYSPTQPTSDPKTAMLLLFPATLLVYASHPAQGS